MVLVGALTAALLITGGAPLAAGQRALVGPVTVAVAAPATATYGTWFDYTITVTHPGGLTDVTPEFTLTDALPPEVDFITLSITSGTCTRPAPGTNGAVACTLPVRSPDSHHHDQGHGRGRAGGEHHEHCPALDRRDGLRHHGRQGAAAWILHRDGDGPELDHHSAGRRARALRVHDRNHLHRPASHETGSDTCHAAASSSGEEPGDRGRAGPAPQLRLPTTEHAGWPGLLRR